jgi:hypothetical protein
MPRACVPYSCYPDQAAIDIGHQTSRVHDQM